MIRRFSLVNDLNIQVQGNPFRDFRGDNLPRALEEVDFGSMEINFIYYLFILLVHFCIWIILHLNYFLSLFVNQKRRLKKKVIIMLYCFVYIDSLENLLLVCLIVHVYKLFNWYSQYLNRNIIRISLSVTSKFCKIVLLWENLSDIIIKFPLVTRDSN